MSTAESKVIQANVRALRELGITVGPVWSPADTLADTRYQVNDGTGTRIVPQREIGGFIAGARAARETARWHVTTPTAEGIAIVEPGDTVTSFRGEPATFVRVTRGPLPGKSAKVLVRWPDDRGEFEYYAGVFRLTVEEADR